MLLFERYLGVSFIIYHHIAMSFTLGLHQIFMSDIHYIKIIAGKINPLKSDAAQRGIIQVFPEGLAHHIAWRCWI